MFFFYFKEYKKTGIDCSSIPESLEPDIIGIAVYCCDSSSIFFFYGVTKK
jgi:hypothetical protein